MHSRQLLCDVAITMHLTFGAKDPHGGSVQAWVNLGLCENLDSGLDWTGLLHTDNKCHQSCNMLSSSASSCFLALRPHLFNFQRVKGHKHI